MREFVIAPEQEGKGRSFQAFLAASIEADELWEGGMATTDNLRPVWSVVFASEAESRPVVANLRMGKKGAFVADGRSWKKKTDKVEYLKSARYAVLTQRTAHGVASTLYLHDLFTLDPGMVDPKGIAFLLALPAEDVAAQRWDRQAALEHVAPLWGNKGVPAAYLRVHDLAPYFAAYLDRRTRCPMPTDTRFYAHLLAACMDVGLAYVPSTAERHSWREKAWGENDKVTAMGVEALGFTTPLVFKGDHDAFQTVLADTAIKYFDRVGFESGKVGA